MPIMPIMPPPAHLYLLRHAKSSWEDPTLADRDRPLSARGRKSAKAIAQHLEASGIHPSLILCSPARRTVETLQAIAGALHPLPETLMEERLYGASAGALLERIRLLPRDVESVMVIGHNPGIHDLAVGLAGPTASGPLAARFPSGALASFRVHVPWQHLGERPADLLAFLAPRQLPAN